MNVTAMTTPKSHSTAYGTSSMVLGIISLVFFFFPLFTLPLAILALVMSRIQRKRDYQAGEATLGRTKAGFVLGIIGLAWCFIAVIWGGIILLKSAHNMGGMKKSKASPGSPTLSSTRIPPQLPSILSRVPSFSPIFNATTQTEPLSFIR